jgi:hypothetical protein
VLSLRHGELIKQTKALIAALDAGDFALPVNSATTPRKAAAAAAVEAEAEGFGSPVAGAAGGETEASGAADANAAETPQPQPEETGGGGGEQTPPSSTATAATPSPAPRGGGGGGGGGGLSDEQVEALLVPLRLAFDSKSPKIIETTLAAGPHHGLTLVHFSAQREHILLDTSGA